MAMSCQYEFCCEKNKKGVSPVIATVILIGLTVLSVSLVWVIINGVITKQTEETESCFGNFDKVTINNLYTCYDIPSNNFRFSISIGNLDVDKVLVSIFQEGNTNSFEITNTPSVVPGVVNYPEGSSNIKLPGQNSGRTYSFRGVRPDKITLTPTIKNNQCEPSDSLTGIDYC